MDSDDGTLILVALNRNLKPNNDILQGVPDVTLIPAWKRM